MKNRITLNEKILKDLIKEGINNVLSEMNWRTYSEAMKKADKMGREGKVDLNVGRKRANKFKKKSFKEANKLYFGNENGIIGSVDGNMYVMAFGHDTHGVDMSLPSVSVHHTKEGKTWSEVLGAKSSSGELCYIAYTPQGIIDHPATEAIKRRLLGGNERIFMNAFNNAQNFFKGNDGYVNGKWQRVKNDDEDSLNEAQLHKIIKESIKRVLSETKIDWESLKGVNNGTLTPYTPEEAKRNHSKEALEQGRNPSYEKAKAEADKKPKKKPFDWDKFRKENLR